MKTIIFKDKTIKLYDSIDELPIVNFQKYNKYILIDSGLGSDIESVDEHIVNLAKLIKTDLNKAQTELQNLRQTMHLVVSEISPKYLAFASLIHSIDGKEVKDLSDENLKNIISSISEIKHSTIAEMLMRVKKKLISELETYFPEDFNDAREKEIYDLLKKRTVLKLKSIIDDADYSNEIQEIDAILFSKYKPRLFNGKNSAEVKYDKQFETSCMYISQKTGMNAKSMKVLEFYNTLSVLQKQAEAEAKAYKKYK